MLIKQSFFIILTILLATGITQQNVMANETAATQSRRTFTQEDYPANWTFSKTGETVETYFDEKGNFAYTNKYGRKAILIAKAAVNLPNIYNGGRVKTEQIQLSNDLNLNNDKVALTPTDVQTPTISETLTDSKLKVLIEKAPSVSDTRSKIKMMDKRMTETEINEWIAEYNSMGGANAFELEVVRLVNAERAKEGLVPLEISNALMMTARFKSQEMVDLEYFDHISPVYNSHIEWHPKINIINTRTGGGSSGYIVAMFGHENSNGLGHQLVSAGENLARGHVSPQAVVSGWMNSPGHRKPIMSTETKSIGIGRVGYLNGITTANFGY